MFVHFIQRFLRLVHCSDLYCQWLIEAAVGNIINLTVVDSEIQPAALGGSCDGGDYVKIYDGKQHNHHFRQKQKQQH